MALGRALVHNRGMSDFDASRPRSTLLPPPSDDAYDYLELVVTRAMAEEMNLYVIYESQNDIPTLPAFEVALF